MYLVLIIQTISCIMILAQIFGIPIMFYKEMTATQDVNQLILIFALFMVSILEAFMYLKFVDKTDADMATFENTMLKSQEQSNKNHIIFLHNEIDRLTRRETRLAREAKRNAKLAKEKNNQEILPKQSRIVSKEPAPTNRLMEVE